VMNIHGMRAQIGINENADLLCLSADRQLLKMVIS
jgi:hypothetical protein